MEETYVTYIDDECLDIHAYDTDTDDDADDDTEDDTTTLLMMILMMVGAGNCILSKFPAGVPGSLVIGP